jgi:hypothetical protein
MKPTAAETRTAIVHKLAKMPDVVLNAHRTKYPDLWHEVKLRQLELQKLPLDKVKAAMKLLHQQANRVKLTQPKKGQVTV